MLLKKEKSFQNHKFSIKLSLKTLTKFLSFVFCNLKWIKITDLNLELSVLWHFILISVTFYPSVNLQAQNVTVILCKNHKNSIT